MKRNLLIVVAVCGMLALGQAYIMKAETQESVERVDYGLWAKVLERHVNDGGRVDYKAILGDRSDFDRFITIVENADLSKLSAVEKKAFWINAYNAITMKVILDNYPVKDIRFVNFGFVWKKKRDVALEKLSLGHIEHKILRPLGDPRIHFAINCASGGCPKLPNKPFYPETLDEQLDVETRRFINDPEKVRLDRKEDVLYYSAIFGWFEEDFLVKGKDLASYIKVYIKEDDRKYLEANQVNLKVLKYDWSLNKQ